MLRSQPPLSQLHFFAPETEEEKRLRQEMGFGALSDPQPQSDGMNTAEDKTSFSTTTDAETGRENQSGSRPIVPISQYDTSVSTTTVGPAPRSSDLRLSADPHSVHHAILTSPSMVQESHQDSVVDQSIITDSTTLAMAKLPPAAPSGSDDVDMDNANLAAASFISAKPAMTEVEKGKAKAKAEPVGEFGGGDEDSDGPLPELDSGDSDMDFGEDEEDEGDGDEE